MHKLFLNYSVTTVTVTTCVWVWVWSVPGLCVASIWSVAPWPLGSPACTQCVPLWWSAKIKPRPHTTSQTDQKNALYPSAASGEKEMRQSVYDRETWESEKVGRIKEVIQGVCIQICIWRSRCLKTIHEQSSETDCFRRMLFNGL